jgi:hypothetical protein
MGISVSVLADGQAGPAVKQHMPFSCPALKRKREDGGVVLMGVLKLRFNPQLGRCLLTKMALGYVNNLRQLFNRQTPQCLLCSVKLGTLTRW